MAMIQGIDGMALINAFRQGREDGTQDRMRQMQMQKQQEAQGLLRQVYGGTAAPRGVQGMAMPQTAGQTFGGDKSMPQANTGSPLPPLVQPTQPAPQAPSGGINYDALSQLATIDPDTAGKVATAIKTMNEAQIKAVDAKNMSMGTAAHYLLSIPQNERAQVYQQIVAPTLAASGWTPQEIAGADLTDRGLQYYQMHSMDMDKLLAAELAERKFQAGDNVALVPGAGLANVRPTLDANGRVIGNTASVVIQPNTGAAPATNSSGFTEGQTATNPQTGEKVIFKGGAWVPMGGGASNGTGGFRP